MLSKMADAKCPWRHKCSVAFGNLLVFNDCQTTVHLLFLCPQHGCCGQHSGRCKERTAGIIYLIGVHRLSGFLFHMLFFLIKLPVSYSPVPASVYAVHTGYTAAVIYLVRLAVDACRLAFPCT